MVKDKLAREERESFPERLPPSSQPREEVEIKGRGREKSPLLATKNCGRKARVESRKSVEKEVCSDFPSLSGNPPS